MYEEHTYRSEAKQYRLYDYQRILRQEAEQQRIRNRNLNGQIQQGPGNTQKRKQKQPIDVISEGIRAAYRGVALFMAVFFAFAFINVYVIRSSYVSGSSMQPTFQEHDRIYTSMVPYFLEKPKIGDIVIIDIDAKRPVTFADQVQQILKQGLLTKWMYKDPTPNSYWIKRVVGVAGDVLEFKDRRFYRNGELVQEDYLKEQLITSYDDSTITVEEGYVYVMGDNRNVSQDSRYVGQIPISSIVGKYVSKK